MIEDEDLHAGAIEGFQMERASSGGYGYLNGMGAGPVELSSIPKPIVYIGIAILLYFLFKELKK